MKKLLLILLLMSTTNVFAQDVIVKKDGSAIVCRVMELSETEIVYKKWSDLNGSNYVMNRADASTINYENGKQINLSEATNLYLPNNQNDGKQNYNDKALLRIDATINAVKAPEKKAKIWRILGLTIGPALVGGGIWLEIENSNYILDARSANNPAYIWGGIALMAGGVAFTTTSLVLAHKYQSQAEMLQTTALFQHKIKLGDNSSLLVGADILRDKRCHESSFGLGLRIDY